MSWWGWLAISVVVGAFVVLCEVVNARRTKRPLAEQAKLERRPSPPDRLVDASREHVALEPGTTRPAKSVKVRREGRR